MSPEEEDFNIMAHKIVRPDQEILAHNFLGFSGPKGHQTGEGTIYESDLGFRVIHGDSTPSYIKTLVTNYSRLLKFLKDLLRGF